MEIISKKWAVLPFAFLQMVGLSANYFIVPQLMVSKLCHKMFNQTVCNRLGKSQFKMQEDAVFSQAAKWNALYNFAGFFPATLIVLPLGAMTDFIPKQRALLLPAIVSLVSCIISLCSATFISLHVGFLVVASFATSVFGEVPGCIMLCSTYAVSASSNDRTLVLLTTVAATEVGIGVGSLVENYFARHYGYSSAFLLATTCLVIDLLYALILIPPVEGDCEQPLPGEQYDFWNGFKEHIKETLLHLLSFIKKHILHPKDNTILLLLIATFFNMASYGGERALISLFLKHSPLNLKADQIGIYLTLFQFNRALGLFSMALLLKKYSQLSDYTLMFIGTLSKIVKYTVLSFSTTTLMLYLSTILAIPASTMGSGMRSKLTKLVPNEEYGVSLSFVGLLGNSSVLVVSLAANWLFAETAKIYSGLSILLMACSNLVCLGLLCYVFFTKEVKAADKEGYHGISIRGDKDDET